MSSEHWSERLRLLTVDDTNVNKRFGRPSQVNNTVTQAELATTSNRGCTGEMAKIFFSSNSHKTCQYYGEWYADYLSSRTKKNLPEGPRFSRNVSKKSILPVKWGVMRNMRFMKVLYFLKNFMALYYLCISRCSKKFDEKFLPERYFFGKKR